MSENLLINVEQNTVLKVFAKTATRQQMLDRKILASKREKEQAKMFESEKIFKASVHAKLLAAGAREFCAEHNQKWFENFSKCEVEEYVQMCEACQRVRVLKYRCSLKWCPCCNWRVSLKRKELMERMTQGIYDCKHIVLTQRNFTEKLREKIVQSRKNLLSLRRQRIFGVVTGGCASLEFTNEKKGWHLHWHLLVQSKFISEQKLSLAWGALVEQEYAIVKVITVDELSYLKEVCKYVVMGSELAKWSPGQILEFVLALRGTRCFSTFGKFRELQKFARALLECEKIEAEPCQCGGDNYIHAKTKEEAYRIHDKIFA